MSRPTLAEIEAKSAKNRAARTANPRAPKSLHTVADAFIDAQVAAKIKKTRQQSPRKPSKASEGERILAFQLGAEKISGWCREYRFAAPRKWRADFAFLNARLLVEVEGGHWSNGRHNRGSGFEADIEKYNAATLAHWALLRFTTKQVKDGTAIKTITRYLEG